jgi:hypothetical protein
MNTAKAMTRRRRILLLLNLRSLEELARRAVLHVHSVASLRDVSQVTVVRICHRPQSQKLVAAGFYLESSLSKVDPESPEEKEF